MSSRGRVATFLRSLGMGVVLVSLWTWLVPRALHFHVRADFALGQFRTIAGACVCTSGIVLWVACLIQFAFEGRGTLVPVDAPRKLVIGGLYRHVRNPMYLAVSLILVGEAVALANVDRYLLIYFACLAVAFLTFVRFYEEPHLRKLFGAEYDEYCAHVRRWLPSIRPWQPKQSAERVAAK